MRSVFLKNWQVLAALLVVNFLVHLPFMDRVPSGAHVWRQCNTLAMSRNFVYENEGIFKPRIDRRNETNGITGSHFPLYEFTLSFLYRLLGEHHWVERGYSLLLTSFSAFAIFLILKAFGTDHTRSFLSSFLFCSVPQLYYDGINAMPDNLALFLSLFSLYSLIRYRYSGDTTILIASLLLAASGGMIKFQFLILPFSALILFAKDWQKNLLLLIGMVLVLVPVFCWYRYALILTDTNNLREFGLWIKPISLQDKLDTLSGNLLSDLPEMLTGWALFPLSVYCVFKDRKVSDYKLLMVSFVGLLGFVGFYILAIERMKHHSYYFMPLIPVLILFINSFSSFRNLPVKVLFVVVLLNFVWAAARIIPSRWTDEKSGIPKEFLDTSFSNRFKSVVPEGARVLIGPDQSGCVFFYFTGTKGYSFEDPYELPSMKKEGPFIDVLLSHGVHYLIYTDTTRIDPIVTELNGWELKEKIGSFKVWVHE